MHKFNSSGSHIAVTNKHSDRKSINLRIGTVQKVDTPTNSIRHFATWLSHKDIAQLVRCGAKCGAGHSTDC